MAETTDFAYDPLPNNSTYIRLLTLHPADSSDARLECQLESFPRDQAPPYQALSYVWGPITRDFPLLCNGKSMRTTESLDVALRRLRLPYRDLRRVWIDQICINQKDDSERSAQVQEMRDVYAGAIRVVIWLGRDSEDRAPAARRILARMHSLLHTVKARPPSAEIEDDDLAAWRLPDKDSSEWADLDALVCLPYFSRIWIIQEVRTARDAIVWWGDTVISWDGFRDSSSFVIKNYFGLSTLVKRRFSNTIAFQILPLIVATTGWIKLYERTRDHAATDPRDLIFALAGLLEEETPLRVNYGKTLAEVHAQAALHVVKTTRSLEFLMYAGRECPGQSDDTPNWAPLWNTKHRSRNFLDLPFRASGGRGLELGENHDWRVLSLRGVPVDKVNTAGPTILVADEWITDYPLLSKLLESYNILATCSEKNKLAEKYDAENGILKAFVATLYLGANTDSLGQRHAAPDGTQLRIFLCASLLKILAYLGQKKRPFPWPIVELAQLVSEAVPEDEFLAVESISPELMVEAVDEPVRIYSELHEREALRAITIITRLVNLNERFNFNSFQMLSHLSAVRSKKLFVSKGGLMGLGPETMEKGDVVCLLFGGDLLYALRLTETAREYLFIGPCYVHGLMYGETMDRYERGEVQSQIFHLR